MNVTLFPKLTFEKISKERIFELLRVVVYTVCFTGIIIHLNEHNNIFFQTRKDCQMLIVMIFFMVMLFTLQKVKLWNIQSLIVTLLFLPFAILKIKSQAAMPDIFRNGILEHIIKWFAAMIVVDMVATGRVRKFKDMNLWIVGLYCIMTILMAGLNPTGIAFRLYLYVLLLFFIPVDGKEWGLLTGGLMNAGVLSFGLVVIASLKLNPQIIVEAVEDTEEIIDPSAGGRWYGYFLNIGTFGQFLGMQTGIALLSIIRAKERYGRFGLVYCLSVMYLAAVFFIAILNGTSNYMVGLIFLLVILIVFGFRKTEHPKLLIRGGIMLCVLLLAGFIFLNIMRALASSGFDKKSLEAVLQKTPLRLFPSGMNTLINKMNRFHNNPWAGDAFFGNPVLAFLNAWGSSRPVIWKAFGEYFSFGANTGTVLYGTFDPQNAHSGYVQAIYNFGYLAGGLNILFFISAWIASIVGYVRKKSEAFFAPMVLLTVMLGMWIGEMSNVTFALTVIPLIICIPAISVKQSRTLKLAENTSGKKLFTFGRSKRKAGKERYHSANPWLTIIPTFMIAVIILMLTIGLVKRIRKDYAYNYSRGEELFTINDELVSLTADNGLISSAEVTAGNESGIILADASQIEKTLERTYWGDKEYARFSFDGAQKGHLMILEFSAFCNQPDPVKLEVKYNSKTTEVEVNASRSMYYLPLVGVEGKGSVMLQYETVEDQKPVELGDLCLVDYGEWTMISSLKTGQYSTVAYETAEKSIDDVFAKARTTLVVGDYLYAFLNGEIVVYPVNSAKKDEDGEFFHLKGIGDAQDATLSDDGKTLAVFSAGSGVYFVDVTNPAEPELLSRFDTTEWCYGGDLYGNYAFLCNRYFGIDVVDISDKTNPKYVTRVQFPIDSEYRNCRVYDGYLYAIAVSNKRIDVYDVRDLSEVKGVTTLETDGNPMGVFAQNETLYVATARSGALKSAYGGINSFHNGAANGMEIYDISAADEPKLLSRTRIDGRYNYYPHGVYDITVKGRYAYVSLMTGGLWIYDVSDPAVPVPMENINISVGVEDENFKGLETDKYFLPYRYWEKTHGSITHTAVADGKVFCLAGDFGLFEAETKYTDKAAAESVKQTALHGSPAAVTEVGTPDNVEVSVMNPGGCIYSLAELPNGQMVAACGEEGIKVLSSNMSLVCSVSTMGAVKDVKARGNMVYAVESPGTLRVYRYEGSILSEVGEISDTSASPWYSSLEVSEDGKLAVVQAWNGSCRIVDLRNPSAPVFIKNPADKGTGATYFRNMCIGLVKGKYIGVAGNTRINWFYEDESKAGGSGDGFAKYMEDKSESKVNEWNGLAAFGDNCIVITDNGYKIFDPESGKIVAKYEGDTKDGFKGKCAVYGNYLILSRSWEGRIRIFDLSDAKHPVEVATFDTDFVTDVPCIVNDTIYIPCRHDGVMKVELK